MAKESKEDKKPVGMKWWVKGLLFTMAILLVLDSVQLLNMSEIVGRVDKYNQGVVDEMGLFRGDVESFGTDLNEIRKFLLLPEKNYSNAEGQPVQSGQDEQQSSPDQVGLYSFLTQYSTEQKAQQVKQAGLKAYTDLSKNGDFVAKIKAGSLTWQNVPQQEMQAKLIDKLAKNADGSPNVLVDQPLFAVFFNTEENLFHVQSALGDKTFDKYTDAGFAPTIGDYVSSNIANARIEKLKQKQIADQNAGKDAAATQSKIEQQKKDFENTLHDPAFTQTLKDQGLKLADKSHEDNNKLIYDVLDDGGQIKFAFALEVSSGMLKVIKDGQELNVQEFSNMDGSKKKP